MEKLLDIRKRIGLTQVEAANKLGVSLRTYQRYENENTVNEKIANKLQI